MLVLLSAAAVLARSFCWWWRRRRRRRAFTLLYDEYKICCSLPTTTDGRVMMSERREARGKSQRSSEGRGRAHHSQEERKKGTYYLLLRSRIGIHTKIFSEEGDIVNISLSGIGTEVCFKMMPVKYNRLTIIVAVLVVFVVVTLISLHGGLHNDDAISSSKPRNPSMRKIDDKVPYKSWQEAQRATASFKVTSTVPPTDPPVVETVQAKEQKYLHELPPSLEVPEGESKSSYQSGAAVVHAEQPSPVAEQQPSVDAPLPKKTYKLYSEEKEQSYKPLVEALENTPEKEILPPQLVAKKVIRYEYALVDEYLRSDNMNNNNNNNNILQHTTTSFPRLDASYHSNLRKEAQSVVKNFNQMDEITLHGVNNTSGSQYRPLLQFHNALRTGDKCAATAPVTKQDFGSVALSTALGNLLSDSPPKVMFEYPSIQKATFVDPVSGLLAKKYPGVTFIIAQLEASMSDRTTADDIGNQGASAAGLSINARIEADLQKQLLEPNCGGADSGRSQAGGLSSFSSTQQLMQSPNLFLASGTPSQYDAFHSINKAYDCVQSIANLDDFVDDKLPFEFEEAIGSLLCRCNATYVQKYLPDNAYFSFWESVPALLQASINTATGLCEAHFDVSGMPKNAVSGVQASHAIVVRNGSFLASPVSGSSSSSSSSASASVPSSVSLSPSEAKGASAGKTVVTNSPVSSPTSSSFSGTASKTTSRTGSYYSRSSSSSSSATVVPPLPQPPPIAPLTMPMQEHLSISDLELLPLDVRSTARMLSATVAFWASRTAEHFEHLYAARSGSSGSSSIHHEESEHPLLVVTSEKGIVLNGVDVIQRRLDFDIARLTEMTRQLSLCGGTVINTTDGVGVEPLFSGEEGGRSSPFKHTHWSLSESSSSGSSSSEQHGAHGFLGVLGTSSSSSLTSSSSSLYPTETHDPTATPTEASNVDSRVTAVVKNDTEAVTSVVDNSSGSSSSSPDTEEEKEKEEEEEEKTPRSRRRLMNGGGAVPSAASKAAAAAASKAGSTSATKTTFSRDTMSSASLPDQGKKQSSWVLPTNYEAATGSALKVDTGRRNELDDSLFFEEEDIELAIEERIDELLLDEQSSLSSSSSSSSSSGMSPYAASAAGGSSSSSRTRASSGKFSMNAESHKLHRTLYSREQGAINRWSSVLRQRSHHNQPVTTNQPSSSSSSSALPESPKSECDNPWKCLLSSKLVYIAGRDISLLSLKLATLHQAITTDYSHDKNDKKSKSKGVRNGALVVSMLSDPDVIKTHLQLSAVMNLQNNIVTQPTWSVGTAAAMVAAPERADTSIIQVDVIVDMMVSAITTTVASAASAAGPQSSDTRCADSALLFEEMIASLLSMSAISFIEVPSPVLLKYSVAAAMKKIGGTVSTPTDSNCITFFGERYSNAGTLLLNAVEQHILSSGGSIRAHIKELTWPEQARREKMRKKKSSSSHEDASGGGSSSSRSSSSSSIRGPLTHSTSPYSASSKYALHSSSSSSRSSSHDAPEEKEERETRLDKKSTANEEEEEDGNNMLWRHFGATSIFQVEVKHGISSTGNTDGESASSSSSRRLLNAHSFPGGAAAVADGKEAAIISEFSTRGSSKGFSVYSAVHLRVVDSQRKLLLRLLVAFPAWALHSGSSGHAGVSIDPWSLFLRSEVSADSLPTGNGGGNGNGNGGGSSSASQSQVGRTAASSGLSLWYQPTNSYQGEGEAVSASSSSSSSSSPPLAGVRLDVSSAKADAERGRAIYAAVVTELLSHSNELAGGRFSFVEHNSGFGYVSTRLAARYPNATVISIEGDASKVSHHVDMADYLSLKNNAVCLKQVDDATIFKNLYNSPELFRFQLFSESMLDEFANSNTLQEWGNHLGSALSTALTTFTYAPAAWQVSWAMFVVYGESFYHDSSADSAAQLEDGQTGGAGGDTSSKHQSRRGRRSAQLRKKHAHHSTAADQQQQGSAGSIVMHAWQGPYRSLQSVFKSPNKHATVAGGDATSAADSYAFDFRATSSDSSSSSTDRTADILDEHSKESNYLKHMASMSSIYSHPQNPYLDFESTWLLENARVTGGDTALLVSPLKSNELTSQAAAFSAGKTSGPADSGALTIPLVRCDIVNMTRHVHHHYDYSKDGHTRTYTMRVAVNHSATAAVSHLLSSAAVAHVSQNLDPPLFSDPDISVGVSHQRPAGVTLHFYADNEPFKQAAVANSGAEPLLVVDLSSGLHPNQHQIVGVHLYRDKDTFPIPYTSIHGVTLITTLRLGLEPKQRDKLFSSFLNLPLYEDMAPWNVVLMGEKLDYIDYDTRDITFDEVVSKSYQIMTVLMNYKRTVEDFKRCGNKAPTVYGLPYVSDCVSSSFDKRLHCDDLKRPVPCADGECHTDYISCLKSLSNSAESLISQQEEQQEWAQAMSKHQALPPSLAAAREVEQWQQKQQDGVVAAMKSIVGKFDDKSFTPSVTYDEFAKQLR